MVAIMRTHNYSPRRSGFTILEMMISMVIFLVVMGSAASVFKMQSRTIAEQGGRLEAQQNARFALQMIERELRMGGLALGNGQPSLVEAAPLAVAFNTNLVAKDTTDHTAVYGNPDADSRTVGMYPVIKALPLPGTTDYYPDTSYEASPGTPSRAETIAYWLSKDSTSSRTDEYILWRRVNYAPPLVITKGVIVGASDTVFQYFAMDTTNVLAPIALSRLPATHTMKMHKANGDTGAVALVDSVRAVKVRLKIIYKDARGIDAIREYMGRVTILNAGAAQRATCGSAPLPVSPLATPAVDPDGNAYVSVTWSPSVDENGGEKDVERYAIYRRLASETVFEEPLGSVPAGETSYSYSDTNVEPGGQYVYGVTAQDCSPAMSAVTLTAVVQIP
jgi:prepilin-type N-terminal cleavage/methylation domain-containing protein